MLLDTLCHAMPRRIPRPDLQVAILTGFAGIPWVIKPLYGFISDSFPLFGYRRRSYLVLCGLLSASSWAALCGAVEGPSGAVVRVFCYRHALLAVTSAQHRPWAKSVMQTL